MTQKFLSFTLIYLVSFGYLASQEIPFLSSFFHAPWNTSLWETSYSIPRQDPEFLDAIAIPFQFPMETALVYSYTQDANLQTGRTSFNNDSRFSQAWNSDMYLNSGKKGLAFLYRKRNFGLNLDFSLLMTGTILGINIAEARESKVRFSYKLPTQALRLGNSDTRVDLFLELSELQALQPGNQYSFGSSVLGQSLFRSGENSNRPGLMAKQLYASPGISLSKSNTFIFEGQVRVPMNAREANRTLDDLWTPEIQTHLGMKYIIPVTGLE